MASCKKCVHHRVCFKQTMRDKITPKGFELNCNDFRSKNDLAELVRCKDCKHLTKDGFCWVNIKAMGYKIPQADDFCSYGERKMKDD